MFPLFTFVCTRETQSRKAHFFPSVYTRGRNVKGAKVAAYRRIRVSSGWIAASSVSVEIYVSEIISFSFSRIKCFISSVFSCDERSETKFDNIFLFFTKAASSKVIKVTECVALLHIQCTRSNVISLSQRYNFWLKLKSFIYTLQLI